MIEGFSSTEESKEKISTEEVINALQESRENKFDVLGKWLDQKHVEIDIETTNDSDARERADLDLNFQIAEIYRHVDLNEKAIEAYYHALCQACEMRDQKMQDRCEVVGSNLALRLGISWPPEVGY